jgi:hypothetical protein
MKSKWLLASVGQGVSIGILLSMAGLHASEPRWWLCAVIFNATVAALRWEASRD